MIISRNERKVVNQRNYCRDGRFAIEEIKILFFGYIN